MSRRVRLGASAERDVAAARDWYSAQQPDFDLDLAFQSELESVFLRMESFPQAFPVVYKYVRRANLNKFPYAVFYQLRGDDLLVIAVVHHARHPRVWKRRR